MIIPIVSATNNDYVKHLSVALTSLKLTKNDDVEYRVIVLGNELTDESQTVLKNSCISKGISIQIIEIKDKYKKMFLSISYFSATTLFRILTPNLITNYDKVIYLDADTIVQSSLEELWSFNIQNYSLAAFAEPRITTQKRASKLGVPLNYTYLCSGVLILNLKKMRETFFTDRAIKLYQEKKEQLLYPDQDLLNIILHNDYYPLPFKYNYMPHLLKYHIIREGRANELNDKPVIVHFVGKTKPDSYLYIGEYKKQYLHYLKQVSQEYAYNIDYNILNFFKKLLLRYKYYIPRVKTSILIKLNLFRLQQYNDVLGKEISSQ